MAHWNHISIESILNKKEGKDRSKLISFKLYEAHYGVCHPRDAKMLTTELIRYIKTKRKFERRVPSFASEIRQKILCLHEYNLKIGKIYKYPMSQQFNDLLIKYIELECESLYARNNDVDEKEENHIRTRVVGLLQTILYDALYNNKISMKQNIYNSKKAVFNLFVNVRADCARENNLVGTVIVQLLEYLGLLDDVNQLKGKNIAFHQDSQLTNPLVTKIRESLMIKDFDENDDFASDDEIDQIAEDSLGGLEDDTQNDNLHFDFNQSFLNRKEKRNFPINGNNCNSNLGNEIQNSSIRNVENKSENNLLETNFSINNNDTDCVKVAETNQQQEYIVADSISRNPKPENRETSEFSLSQPNIVTIEISDDEDDDGQQVNSNSNNSQMLQTNEIKLEKEDEENRLPNFPLPCSDNNQDIVDASKTNKESNSNGFSLRKSNSNNSTKTVEGNQVVVSNEETSVEPEITNNVEKSEISSSTAEIDKIVDKRSKIQNNDSDCVEVAETNQQQEHIVADLNSHNQTPENRETSELSLSQPNIVTIEISDDEDDDGQQVNSNSNNSRMLQTNEIKLEKDEENRSPNFPLPCSDNNQDIVDASKTNKESNSNGFSVRKSNSNNSTKTVEGNQVFVSNEETSVEPEITNNVEKSEISSSTAEIDKIVDKRSNIQNNDSDCVEVAETNQQQKHIVADSISRNPKPENRETSEFSLSQPNIVTIEISDDEDDDGQQVNSNSNNSQMLQTNEIKLEEEDEENRSPNFPLPCSDNNQDIVDASKTNKELNSNGFGVRKSNSNNSTTTVEGNEVFVSHEKTSVEPEITNNVKKLEISSSKAEIDKIVDKRSKIETSVTDDTLQEPVNVLEESHVVSFSEKNTTVSNDDNDFLCGIKVNESFVGSSQIIGMCESTFGLESISRNMFAKTNKSEEITENIQQSSNNDNEEQRIDLGNNLQPVKEALTEESSPNAHFEVEDEGALQSVENITEEVHESSVIDDEDIIESNIIDSGDIIETTISNSEDKTKNNIPNHQESPESIVPNTEELIKERIGHSGVLENVAIKSKKIIKENISDVTKTGEMYKTISTEISTEDYEQAIKEIESVLENANQYRLEGLPIVHATEEVVSTTEMSTENLSQIRKQTAKEIVSLPEQANQLEDLATVQATEEVVSTAESSEGYTIDHVESKKPREYYEILNEEVKNNTILDLSTKEQPIECNVENNSDGNKNLATNVEPSMNDPSATIEESLVNVTDQPMNTLYYNKDEQSTDINSSEYQNNSKTSLQFFVDIALTQETLPVKSNEEFPSKDTKGSTSSIMESNDETENSEDLGLIKPRRKPKSENVRRIRKKQKVNEDFENKRITRSRSHQIVNKAEVKVEDEFDILKDSTTYNVQDFKSTSVLPTGVNNVYTRVESNFTSEDSDDFESVLHITEPEVISVYDEDTIDDKLTFIQSGDQTSVCISIPETEMTTGSRKFDILFEMESYLDKTKEPLENIETTTTDHSRDTVEEARGGVPEVKALSTVPTDHSIEKVLNLTCSAHIEQSSALSEELHSSSHDENVIEEDCNNKIESAEGVVCEENVIKEKIVDNTICKVDYSRVETLAADEYSEKSFKTKAQVKSYNDLKDDDSQKSKQIKVRSHSCDEEKSRNLPVSQRPRTKSINSENINMLPLVPCREYNEAVIDEEQPSVLEEVPTVCVMNEETTIKFVAPTEVVEEQTEVTEVLEDIVIEEPTHIIDSSEIIELSEEVVEPIEAVEPTATSDQTDIVETTEIEQIHVEAQSQIAVESEILESIETEVTTDIVELPEVEVVESTVVVETTEIVEPTEVVKSSVFVESLSETIIEDPLIGNKIVTPSESDEVTDCKNKKRSRQTLDKNKPQPKTVETLMVENKIETPPKSDKASEYRNKKKSIETPDKNKTEQKLNETLIDPDAVIENNEIESSPKSDEVVDCKNKKKSKETSVKNKVEQKNPRIATDVKPSEKSKSKDTSKSSQTIKKERALEDTIKKMKEKIGEVAETASNTEPLIQTVNEEKINPVKNKYKKSDVTEHHSKKERDYRRSRSSSKSSVDDKRSHHSDNDRSSKRHRRSSSKSRHEKHKHEGTERKLSSSLSLNENKLHLAEKLDATNKTTQSPKQERKRSDGDESFKTKTSHSSTPQTSQLKDNKISSGEKKPKHESSGSKTRSKSSHSTESKNKDKAEEISRHRSKSKEKSGSSVKDKNNSMSMIVNDISELFKCSNTSPHEKIEQNKSKSEHRSHRSHSIEKSKSSSSSRSEKKPKDEQKDNEKKKSTEEVLPKDNESSRTHSKSKGATATPTTTTTAYKQESPQKNKKRDNKIKESRTRSPKKRKHDSDEDTDRKEFKSLEKSSSKTPKLDSNQILTESNVEQADKHNDKKKTIEASKHAFIKPNETQIVNKTGLESPTKQIYKEELVAVVEKTNTLIETTVEKEEIVETSTTLTDGDKEPIVCPDAASNEFAKMLMEKYNQPKCVPEVVTDQVQPKPIYISDCTLSEIQTEIQEIIPINTIIKNFSSDANNESALSISNVNPTAVITENGPSRAEAMPSCSTDELPNTEIFESAITLDELSPTKLHMGSNQSLDLISLPTESAINIPMNFVNPINFLSNVQEAGEIVISDTIKSQPLSSNFVRGTTKIFMEVKGSATDHNYTFGDPLLSGNKEDRSILKEAFNIGDNDDDFFKKENSDDSISIDDTDPEAKPEEIQNMIKTLNQLVDKPTKPQTTLVDIITIDNNSFDHTPTTDSNNTDFGVKYAFKEICSLRSKKDTTNHQTATFRPILDINKVNIMDSGAEQPSETTSIQNQPSTINLKNIEYATEDPLPNYMNLLPSSSVSNPKVIVQRNEPYPTIMSAEPKKEPIPKSNTSDIIHSNNNLSNDKTKAELDKTGKTPPPQKSSEIETTPPYLNEPVQLYVRKNTRTPVCTNVRKSVSRQSSSGGSSMKNDNEVLSFVENLNKHEPNKNRIRVKADLMDKEHKEKSKTPESNHQKLPDLSPNPTAKSISRNHKKLPDPAKCIPASNIPSISGSASTGNILDVRTRKYRPAESNPVLHPNKRMRVEEELKDKEPVQHHRFGNTNRVSPDNSFNRPPGEKRMQRRSHMYPPILTRYNLEQRLSMGLSSAPKSSKSDPHVSQSHFDRPQDRRSSTEDLSGQGLYDNDFTNKMSKLFPKTNLFPNGPARSTKF